MILDIDHVRMRAKYTVMRLNSLAKKQILNDPTDKRKPNHLPEEESLGSLPQVMKLAISTNNKRLDNLTENLLMRTSTMDWVEH